MKCKRETDGRKHGRGALPVMRQQAVKAVRSGQGTVGGKRLRGEYPQRFPVAGGIC